VDLALVAADLVDQLRTLSESRSTVRAVKRIPISSLEMWSRARR